MLLGSGAGLTRRGGGKTGVGVDDVAEGNAGKMSWAKGCDLAGYGPVGGALAAVSRLCLWHLLQPTVYLLALALYWPTLGPWSHTLGALVGVREVVYVAFCFMDLFTNPAYLLVDLGATLRSGSHIYDALIYVFAPDKFVILAANISGNARAVLLVGGFLLDTCAIAALVVAVVPDRPFPAALLVGYTLTALVPVTALLALIDNCTCKLIDKANDRRKQLH